MKIGIFTLHSNTNFGGGLQQIALFEILKTMGHDPQVVCVRNDVPQSTFRRILGVLSSYSFSSSIRELKSRCLQKKVPQIDNLELYKRCDAFNHENLNYTPKFGMVELPKYCKQYDAIIVGSDQVWTDVYSNVHPCFCDGIGDFKGLRIAYAACSAHNRVPFYNRKHIRQSLDKFTAISVRDTTTACLVESVGCSKPVIVADPTLLYDFEKYIKPVTIKKPYIFAYVLGDKPAEWHAKNIEYICKTVGNIKVIALTTELNENYPWADEVLTGELAVDWMNLLRNSQFVYTNSFHAVIFSLKFHKEFVAYYGDLVRSSRMISLITQFGLASRIVREPIEVDYTTSVDFSEIDLSISELRNKSMEFLSNSLINKS
ncbi:polysaccharide pyruvyl transferase family protein [Bacteroides congonensis]|jgi:polysaccharide pyruvyl transferase WcaK-like protein|uniref:polysaccharide pyruvyl transferase family protein n=1 Tax=Bacteroides congonensis TaxID=1871006 RepID=UPI00033BF921|nr:polysaccharide pyruvyl transferase family protein [Bacteroides congonensis]CDA84751.1 uncharacterized protein BN772_03169 [Bacteroides sp. CAG:754]